MNNKRNQSLVIYTNFRNHFNKNHFNIKIASAGCLLTNQMPILLKAQSDSLGYLVFNLFLAFIHVLSQDLLYILNHEQIFSLCLE